MESHIEDVGDILDDSHLLFEVNSTSNAIVKDLVQHGTSTLLGPTSVIDLGDSLDELHLLFDGDDHSTIVARAHFDPHVHSLHDQSLEVL